MINVADVNQWCWLEESGQWLENVIWTHLVLASGKQVLQNWLSIEFLLQIWISDFGADDPTKEETTNWAFQPKIAARQLNKLYVHPYFIFWVARKMQK